MSTSGGNLKPSDDAYVEEGARRSARFPYIIHLLAWGAILLCPAGVVAAYLLPEIAGDQWVSIAQAGLLITMFAVGAIVVAWSPPVPATRSHTPARCSASAPETC